MENKVNDILNQLDNGKIRCKDAIKIIKNNEYKANEINRKASGIKISIIDKDHTIRIPKIPFGLIIFLIDIGFNILSIATRFTNSLDEDLKKILDSVDRKDIKEIFKALKKHGSFDLVDIKEGDNTEVKISILW